MTRYYTYTSRIVFTFFGAATTYIYTSGRHFTAMVVLGVTLAMVVLYDEF